MLNAMLCDRCGGTLESDDAISIIDGICCACRKGQARPVGETARQAMPAPEVVFGSTIIRDSMKAPVLASDHSESTLVLDTSESIEEFDDEPVIALTSVDDAPPRVGRRRRNLAVGVMVGLAVIAVAAVYAFQYGVPSLNINQQRTVDRVPVRLRVSPPSATLRLDGEPIGPADANGILELKLEPDAMRTYTVDASADGFHPARQTLSTLGGQHDFEIRLVHKPFDLVVRSEPSGAEVWIAGELRGVTPLTMTLPASATGRLAVKHIGRKTEERPISVPSDAGPLAYDVKLPLGGPVVRVETEPPGAQVSIDGVSRGVSPLNVELSEAMRGRTVQIAGSLEGHNDAQSEVIIPEDAAEVIPTRLALSPFAAEIRIDSEPTGATLRMEGRDIGTAPVSVRFEPGDVGKTVSIEAVVPGVRIGRRTATIPPVGPPLTLSIPLEHRFQTCVYAFAGPHRRDREWAALTDHAASLIERLTGSQRLALIAGAEGGVEAWPGGSQTLVASSEQKVRAFDRVRAMGSAAAEPAEVIRAALATRPDAIWLMVTGDVDLKALTEIEISPGDAPDDTITSINIVATRPLSDQPWIAEWVARHHGSISVIEMEPGPRLAGHGSGDEQ